MYMYTMYTCMYIRIYLYNVGYRPVRDEAAWNMSRGIKSQMSSMWRLSQSNCTSYSRCQLLIIVGSNYNSEEASILQSPLCGNFCMVIVLGE
jgi:hypothetical protein